MSDKQARKLAETIIATDAVQKERKKTLKAWCTDHGPVDLGNGETYGFKMGESVEWDIGARALLDEDEEKEALKLDGKFMAGLMEDPQRSAKLDLFRKTKPASRFVVTKG